MVYELLRIGESEAVSGKELCAAIGISSRELTQAIERERKAGKPICATTNGRKPGYYIPEDKETMLRYCESLGHRIRSIRCTRNACRIAADKLPSREAQ